MIIINYSWYFNIISLVISFIGALLLYLGTPYDTGGITRFSYGDPDEKSKLRAIKIKRILTKSGFALLASGFVIQIINVSFQYPE